MDFRELITFRNGSTAEPASAQAPFLPREALLGLTLAPPLITLLVEQFGEKPTLVHAAFCLLATWVCTWTVGFALHYAVNWSAPRLFAALQPPLLAGAAVMAVAATTIVLGMLVVVPRLSWVPPEELSTDIARGLGIGGLYVIVARVATLLIARARISDAGATRARISALQAQVSPHFLFNTLNAIASLIPSDPGLAEATLERLAGVLQYSIASGMAQTVSLGEELATVRDYLGIQQARFGPRLRSSIDVSPELEKQTLPPMLLQPLVENAVLHGLASRAEGGEIRISGRTELDRHRSDGIR